jgi:formylglycine-generating enzyme required for sulfatase activity
MSNAAAVEALFFAALEKETEAERAAYLDSACGGDGELRGQVEKMLKAHPRVGDFLQKPAVEQLAAAPEPSGATQDFDASAERKVDNMTRTEGEGASENEDSAVEFLQPSTRPDSLGRLGHYEMLQVLGRGGFGIVFRAFDEVLQRVVALKVMAPQLAATSPARKRFLREARSSAQVRHDNVVQVYEVAEQPLPYLVMEFIPGETLQQKLDRVGPLDVPEVLCFGRQIAEGLAAAHATDLIHRDIKPGNVLLEGSQQKVKITDFGLARAADDASISQSGIIAGTPMYMAPEQAQGQHLDQRADLFSLGSVLYQMVSGRPPFRANTTVAVLKRVAEDQPRPIREIIPETPQWLCDIIARLHAKNPGDRYQSAREVADVLADCEAQLKANARLKDYSRLPRRSPQRSGRRKWVAVAAAVLLPVLALAVMEFAGVTHLFRLGPPKKDAEQPGPAANTSFDAKEAQEASAKQLGIPVEMTNSIGMKLRFIPPGKFTMGSSQKEIDFWLKQYDDGWFKERLPSEGPQHEVEITHPLYMGQTEVTVGQFRKFVQATGYQTQAEREGGAFRYFPNWEWKMDANTNWLNPGFEQTDDHPVVCVSWNDAVAFCNWLSKQEGKTYRLPTEAEWEYSCRAGSKGRWFFGENDGELLNYARIGNNSQHHAWPVAGLKDNAWGLHDMHGNAWEWCQDVYDAHYYETSPPKDPPGRGAGGERVVRGGSWENAPVSCRSAIRHRFDAGDRSSSLGFRILLVVSPPTGVRTESGAKDKPSPPAVAPFTDADVQRIAALPAAQQVEEVRKELMRRNPGFGGKMDTKIEDSVVTQFQIVSHKVADIAPIRVWSALRVLDLYQTKVGDAGLAQLKDCKELTGLWLRGSTNVSDAGLAHLKDCKNLTDLHLEGTLVGDEGLAHLRDCKGLRLLDLGSTRVSNAGLIHLKDCKALTQLRLGHTRVSDAGLANFQGMPLIALWIDHTRITDLTPLQGMPLEDIRLTPKNITRGLDILRAMKSLQTVGIEFNQSWPAAEFWERYDKGEFKE